MNDPRVAYSDMSTELPDKARAAKYAAAGALLQKRIIAARTDFAAFIKYIWANGTNFELADFHLEAISAYSNPSLNIEFILRTRMSRSIRESGPDERNKFAPPCFFYGLSNYSYQARDQFSKSLRVILKRAKFPS